MIRPCSLLRDVCGNLGRLACALSRPGRARCTTSSCTVLPYCTLCFHGLMATASDANCSSPSTSLPTSVTLPVCPPCSPLNEVWAPFPPACCVKPVMQLISACLPLTSWLQRTLPRCFNHPSLFRSTITYPYHRSSTLPLALSLPSLFSPTLIPYSYPSTLLDRSDTLSISTMNSYYFDDVVEAFKTPDVGIPPIPPHLEHPIQSTQWGHTYLWVVFAIMTIFSVLFFISSQRASYRYRLMHTTTFFITAIAACSYFAMATGIGKSYVPDGNKHKHPLREFYYARYIDWALTTPLLLFDLTLLAGLPVAEIIVLVFADEVMIVTGVIAGTHPVKTGKWGFFTISCVAFAWILFQLITSGRSTAFMRSPKVGGLYNQISLALVIVWTLYPIAFALCEGTGKLNPDQEILFFAILDVIAKPLWGAWLLLATPDEGHVLVPESLCAPAGTAASGGYGAISQEPRAEDA
ncbi:family A G protein-coupled receptor-like protein [Testicularia cyperi]|uniref:Family A G protein-coupled receptor-like protein n=1 Tax=Testicularia cyperi TaxID=1882483 RepID=A0A317XXK4_9BASI|nr:family A G protein-coupled receptor-like protein [Testicularia cyperi]